MKLKKLVKKSKQAPDRLRRKAFRLLRKSRSLALRSKPYRIARRYGRMEATRALRLLFKLLHFQISIRPRIRLVSSVVLVLMLALVASSIAVDYIRTRKQDLKINGQAILVAQNTVEPIKPVDIEASIQSKRSPFDFVKPVDGYISQGYRSYHRAVDIATGAVGVPIKSLGTGKVEYTGYMADGHGYTVVVDHGDGLKSLYAHMGKIEVGVGNEVNSSTTLGTVGLTGRTTGAHLHLELYDNGIAVDPSKILPE